MPCVLMVVMTTVSEITIARSRSILLNVLEHILCLKQVLYDNMLIPEQGLGTVLSTRLSKCVIFCRLSSGPAGVVATDVFSCGTPV